MKTDKKIPNDLSKRIDKLASDHLKTIDHVSFWNVNLVV